jgi:hypothetical protein
MEAFLIYEHETGRLTTQALTRDNAFRMVQRRTQEGRDTDKNRVPYFPGNGDHHLPDQWRGSREGAADGGA